MNRKMLTAVVLAALLSLGAIAASADEIVLGGSGSGTWTFTATGGGNLTATPSGAMSGAGGSFQSPNGTPIGGFGTSTLTPSSATAMTLTANGNNFNVSGGPTWTYSFSNTSGDTLSGGLVFSLVKDSTTQPNMIGTLHVTSCSGPDAAFCSDFAVGSNDQFTLTLLTTAYLDTLAAAGTGSYTGVSGFKSGDINPVPEPASLMLFGSGLSAVAAMIRRRKKA